MAEIDLIPADYRRRLGQRRLLTVSAIVAAVVAVLIVGAAEWVRAETARVRSLATALRNSNAITQQQHAELERLQAQESELQRQWSLLRGLRAGAAVEDIYGIIDEALVAGDLWFVDWSFRRAGVVVDGEQRGVETGYFVVVPADAEGASGDRFEVETHMSIHGQARDHRALSAFVRALFEHSHIKDVSLQKTERIDYAGGTVVDFNLTVVLHSAPRNS